MTDYTHSTGSSGTMMIRDLGYNVEFWLNANNSTTWSDHIPWGWVVDWASQNGTYYYHPNSGWQRLATISVGSSTNVTFNLGNTGTSGFGGPTSFTVFLNRATVPPAPNPVQLSSISSTSVHAVFSGNGDGGSGITQWQTGYGTDPNNVQTIINGFNSVISGLTPGTTYYFWGRGINGIGTGGWSNRSQATTLRTPDAPSTPTISDVGPTAVTLTWTANGNGGSPIISFDIGYGLSPSAPTSFITGVTSPKVVSPLQPGTTYYFWVRANNDVGSGPYSDSPSSAMTIAGARVLVSGVWKVAIPYVRDAGVWKKAQPYVRDAGVWKETV